jgi:hypothetical protein
VGLMVEIGLVLVIDENEYLAKPIELPDYPVPGDWLILDDEEYEVIKRTFYYPSNGFVRIHLKRLDESVVVHLKQYIQELVKNGWKLIIND